jgi:hypothetical protein
MVIDLLIMNAWKEAAADLGIRVIAPFEFKTGNELPILFEAFVPDFGSPAGAIVMTEKSRNDIAVKGRWASRLYETYQTYRRADFIETLIDWGWFGDETKTPSWYDKP